MLFGIFAMVLVGASWTIYGGVMGKAPRENIDVSVLLFWTFVASAVVSIVCGTVFQGFPQTSAYGLLIAFSSQFISGFFNYWQLDMMSRAMQKGHNGTVWSIVQAGFVFPFFMGILFFSVPLTWVRGTALFLAVASVAVSGYSREAGAGKWLIPALTAFLMTGISQSLSNLPSYYPEAECVSSVWRTAALSSGFIAGAVIRNIMRLPQFFPDVLASARNVKLWKYCFMLQGIEIIVNYFLLYPGMDSLSRASAGAVAYPLMVSCCLLVFDLYSLLVLREKQSVRQWSALLLCILAVIGLSVQ